MKFFTWRQKFFNTNHLHKHLEGYKNRFIEYIEQEKKKEELQPSKDSYRQVTLEALAEKWKPCATGHPHTAVLTLCIAEMIAVDLQPFQCAKRSLFYHVTVLVPLPAIANLAQRYGYNYMHCMGRILQTNGNNTIIFDTDTDIDIGIGTSLVP